MKTVEKEKAEYLFIVSSAVFQKHPSATGDYLLPLGNWKHILFLWNL